MSIKRRKKSTPVDMIKLKEQLALLIQEKYGSIHKFSKSEAALKLGVEKSVRTIVAKGGKNSLVVINKLCRYFELPEVTSETQITRETNYFIKK